MSIVFSIRPYHAQDFDAVTILWRVSREKSLPEFQLEKGHFFYEDRTYFQQHVLKDNENIWVAEAQEQVIAFMAMNKDFVDQLYVDPDYWRCGVGQALLNLAKQHSPEHVWLYTLQVNINARAFYNANGFVAERFGISPPPESEPDVEYHWRAGS